MAREPAKPASSGSARRVCFFDLGSQHERIRADVAARMERVCAHRQFINGPEVAELEDRLTALAGVRECVAVASGTDALLIALLAEDIGPGDAVFIPALTYIATAGAVRLSGAQPVCVDIRADTLNMDAGDLAGRVRAVRDAGNYRPRAVVPVDLFGLPADYSAIGAVAREHGLFVLADAAQSLGGAAGDRPVGSLADATATSFYPTKPLGCYGDGGALFTDDPARAGRWRAIRVHGFPDGAKLSASRVGLNGRLDTLQAAVLLAKLPVFEAERARREAIARAYDRGLSAGVKLQVVADDRRSARAVYTLRHPRRDDLRAALDGAGIDTAVYYPLAVHQHEAYADLAPDGGLPVAEAAAREVLSLPLHSELDDKQVERVIRAVTTSLAGPEGED